MFPKKQWSSCNTWLTAWENPTIQRWANETNVRSLNPLTKAEAGINSFTTYMEQREIVAHFLTPEQTHIERQEVLISTFVKVLL